ncbi:MAG: phosphate acyltransferase PlsX [Flavobacteriales bacterium]|nr:phosphate acyltransferase PlsX [Flavobacteriales bacterium]MCX7651036.1 phosphate acyltransferase PlsX [Flavobacteriales bacterium]MDW8431842.1 phosphate acyltransferase PlsX [Flavobacteriales bacterium]
MTFEIGLDLFGGDHAPECNLQGLALALEKDESLGITLFGDETIMSPFLKDFPLRHRVTPVHTPDIIEMGDSPMRAVASKPNSSIVTGLKYLKSGKIHGFASAGNTGAIFGAAVVVLGTVMESVRPCLMTLVPRPDCRDAIILDIGANADSKPENLVDFSLLGAAYARHLWKIENPRVGLINIGEEPEKGNELTKAAHKLLAGDPRVFFIGNTEPDKLFQDVADVYVCNGFTGNIILKLSETLIGLVHRLGFRHPYLSRFNYENQGGSPVLGVNGAVVIGHGISNERAVANMIFQTRDIAAAQLHIKIREALLS